MAKNEFALAFNEVLEEKQLAKDVVVSAIESAMVSAYRRAVSASTAQHVEAKLDADTGEVTVYAEKEVVEDSIVDARTEVLLGEAQKVKPDVQVGDMVLVETTPADFGRVAAQTARQVIQQRIREAERSNQMQYFERQVGEIVSGLVQASNAQSATVGLDMKAEGILPNNQKIPGERLKLHDRIRAVAGIHGRISKVNESGTLEVEIDTNTKVIMERSGISMEYTRSLKETPLHRSSSAIFTYSFATHYLF